MQLRSQQEEARWPKLPSCSQQEVVRWPELPSCSLREAGRKPCAVQRALSAFHGVRRASEATSATEAEAARAAMGQRLAAAALKQAAARAAAAVAKKEAEEAAEAEAARAAMGQRMAAAASRAAAARVAAAAARTETEAVAAEEASVARLSLARLSLRDAVLQAEAESCSLEATATLESPLTWRSASRRTTMSPQPRSESLKPASRRAPARAELEARSPEITRDRTRLGEPASRRA